ncbi:MAG: radical SAM protein [Candidatus Peribacteria bacterium]|nr:radical SAM protein [Candidatus Peribacteria bacterium]
MPIPKLVREVENLVQQGAKEIILIAQDSTRYGVDLYGKPQLFELLEEIEVLEGDFRYRVLYLYPDLLTLKQLEKLTGFQKFIPYFDIPLQHSAGSVLKRMGRFYDEKSIHKFLHFIKTAFPLYFIRTNFIIGFPGETEEEFEHLKAFIKLNYFDNIALFEYHDEPLAKSFQLSGKVEEKVIRRRFHELHQLVNQLSINHSQARKGKEEWGWVVEVPLSLGDVAVEKGKV